MADDNRGNFTKNFILILIIIILFVIFYIISPQEPGIKTTYWMVIGLACLSIINIYLSIYYYIKLRSQKGVQGPPGPRGNKGSKGDTGVCAASESCNNIDTTDCEGIVTEIRNSYIEKNHSNIRDCFGENPSAKCKKTETARAVDRFNSIIGNSSDNNEHSLYHQCANYDGESVENFKKDALRKLELEYVI